jgi:hypothetical protein
MYLQRVIGRKTIVGDPDPHVFGPPGSGSISRRCGSGSGSGSRSYPFSLKCVGRTVIMPAKQNFNTRFQQKIKFFRLKMMYLWASYEKKVWGKKFLASLKSMKKGVGSGVGSRAGSGIGSGTGSISQRYGTRIPNTEKNCEKNSFLLAS